MVYLFSSSSWIHISFIAVGTGEEESIQRRRKKANERTNIINDGRMNVWAARETDRRKLGVRERWNEVAAWKILERPSDTSDAIKKREKICINIKYVQRLELDNTPIKIKANTATATTASTSEMRSSNIKQNVKLEKYYYMHAAHEWRKSLKSIIKYTNWIQNYAIHENINIDS